jgi:hypothetical protein
MDWQLDGLLEVVEVVEGESWLEDWVSEAHLEGVSCP